MAIAGRALLTSPKPGGGGGRGGGGRIRKNRPRWPVPPPLGRVTTTRTGRRTKTTTTTATSPTTATERRKKLGPRHAVERCPAYNRVGIALRCRAQQGFRLSLGTMQCHHLHTDTGMAKYVSIGAERGTVYLCVWHGTSWLGLRFMVSLSACLPVCLLVCLSHTPPWLSQPW